MAPFFRREREDHDQAPADQMSVLGGLREAVRGGAAYGKRRAVAAGRAERLGLTELARGTGTALQLPFEFLHLVLLRLLRGLRDRVPADCKR